MRKLMNTLYVTSPNAYLSLDGENVVVLIEDKERIRVPLHNIEGVVTFGYTGASPAFMGQCAKRNIALTFLSQNGRFLARVVGETKGNVVLRREQYRIADSEDKSLEIAKNCIIGKIHNTRSVINRALRDHAARIEEDKFQSVSSQLKNSLRLVQGATTLEELRGYEGEAASRYFFIMDDLILQQKEEFYFHTRNKRPPLDNVNAMLSFTYTLLAHDVAAALETVGLDSYVGFLHRDRPGRVSLALDVMEELRSIFADRFVISLINKRIINGHGFDKQESGAIVMKDETKKEVLKNWQERKQEKIKHPFLEESIEWGLVPYVQAMLLARFIRGDLDGYPPFLWK
ncbi:type I-C CRISPR-associated endonuclease Cas1c [Candidatus Galacturonibacter soehngenii]|uniref:CRISPR-associated endonuclease Cas1 n=1 Tax=Candidatus Galacturonatibacter soehngenii TaxID=2307010 RepID=A0A7V7QJQ6_9FIRM|nr:type I-C CRISPR-associated endonuclease Cas1c [Candidatus Galacturonibacter soehngenii]KAB1437875.1 type I-C CRISPR-associated endonuclease Cas1 [Candidatus Galacturonibacter soehngenii]